MFEFNELYGSDNFTAPALRAIGHALRRASGVYQLRPGITGLAQISGRDLVNDEEKAALDRQYLETLCLSQDVRIFFVTIGKVLRREGVEKK